MLLPRKYLINQIDNAFSKQKGIKFVVLIGEGGKGKTVLARRYLQIINCRVKAEIDAESVENILNSFKELSLSLADTKELQKNLSYIKAIRDKNLQIKQIVHFVFSQLKKRGNWCLLFDNVDDFNTIRDFISIRDSLYGEGKIIITTRNGNFKNMGIFSQNAIIYVPFLSVSEGKKLFSDIIYISKKNDNGKILKNFLQHIPLMPLDVCAAAYYIKNTNVSYQDYLNVIEQPNEASEKLQSTFLTEGINYNESRYAILSAIFKKIIKADVHFKELLLFTCMVNSQNIPISYLEKCSDHITVQKFIHELRRFSLITEKDATFSIHRSTQAIGQQYIFSTLSEKEREQFIENIIKIMTPYKSIMFSMYGMQKNGMNYEEAENFLPHVTACLNKINGMNNLKNKEKYTTALYLSVFNLYGRREYNSDVFNSCEQIINKNRQYIKDIDFAVAQLLSTYISFASENFSIKTIEPRLEKVLKICEHLTGGKNLQTLAYAYLGRLYFENNEPEKGRYYLKKSAQLLDENNGKEWIIPTRALVCHQYIRSYLSYYVFKHDVQKSISFVLETLEILKANKFFYKETNKPQKMIYFVQELRRRLSEAYNSQEMYQEALDSEKESEFFYVKQKHPIRRNTAIKSAMAYTLLRMNKIKEAQETVSEVLEIKEKTLDYDKIYIAFAVSSEINIRRGNFDKARENCENALKFLKNPHSNLTKFTRLVCYYNLAVIEHKQNNEKQSLNYFKIFSKLADEFCKSFLHSTRYFALCDYEAFKNTENIRNYLRNSYRIFVAICGLNHSFIKDYVAENN